MSEVNNNRCPKCFFVSPCIIVLKDHIQVNHGPVKFVILDSFGEKEIEAICSCDDCKCESELKANLAKLLEEQREQNMQQIQFVPFDIQGGVEIKEDGFDYENCVIELVDDGVTPTTNTQEEVIKIEVVDSFSDEIDGTSSEVIPVKNEINEAAPVQNLLTQSNEIQNNASAASYDTFECDYCFFTTYSRELLMDHMQKDICYLHNFICDDCNFETNNEESLNEHLKINHSDMDPVPYKCGQCLFTSVNKGIFVQHIAGKHPDLQATNCYRCAYCQYRAVDSKDFFEHFNVKHQRKYLCSVCSFRFLTKTELDVHNNLTHQNYACAYCDFNSQNMEDFSNHVQNLHGQQK